jgi:hypothetical protein
MARDHANGTRLTTSASLKTQIIIASAELSTVPLNAPFTYKIKFYSEQSGLLISTGADAGISLLKKQYYFEKSKLLNIVAK